MLAKYSGDMNIGLHGPVFKWSKVVGLPFEYQTKFSPVFRPPYEYPTSEYWTSKSILFRCFCYSDVPYSDPHFSHILEKLLGITFFTLVL